MIHPHWLPGSLGAVSEMDRLLRNFLDEVQHAHGQPVGPALNVQEDDDRIRLLVSLPGVDASRLDLQVEGDTLVLSGERPEPASAGARVLRRERAAGRFRREVALPIKVDAEGVSARYQDGLLWIEMKKAPEARPIVIKVQGA